MSGLEPEQKIAAVIRILYRLGVINSDQLNRTIDQLQIRLFERYLASKNQP